MSQQELLKRVVRALENAEIKYMVTGSIVSSLQGEPRSTHDIDFVVAIEGPSIDKLVAAFPASDFYLDKESIADAIKRKAMFNLIDMKDGDKADFWILTDDPFDQSRFSRRQTIEVMGIRMQVSRPEDTILVKLKWAKLSGGSEKQFTDALRVYEVQYPGLDMNYLDHWAKKLDIETMWKQIKEKAEVV
ncbi:MAG: hypothetical protein K6T66_11400 [Peptococcaceae bacterium]|nr:hypothetical protein [Peptococcaceae bacterium]